MRNIISILAVAIIFWGVAWIDFLQSVPKEHSANTSPTDAIIVLTGGARRVEYGFEKLAQGAAPLLFITGVGGDSSLDKLFETHTTPQVRSRIDALKPVIVLDHTARSTRMNAEETQKFVQQNGVKSIRLITANYHMPRSVQEIHALMPELTIIADAAFPRGFTAHSWWHQGKARYLLLSEFHKTWAVRLREWAKDARNAAA